MRGVPIEDSPKVSVESLEVLLWIILDIPLAVYSRTSQRVSSGVSLGVFVKSFPGISWAVSSVMSPYVCICTNPPKAVE